MLHQILATDIFYERHVSIPATEITFGLRGESFGTYVVTTCNQEGSSSFEVELRSAAGNGSADGILL